MWFLNWDLNYENELAVWRSGRRKRVLTYAAAQTGGLSLLVWGTESGPVWLDWGTVGGAQAEISWER